MTRKQFIAIAKAISENAMTKENKADLVAALASDFKKANPAFSLPRFLEACLK